MAMVTMTLTIMSDIKCFESVVGDPLLRLTTQ